MLHRDKGVPPREWMGCQPRPNPWSTDSCLESVMMFNDNLSIITYDAHQGEHSVNITLLQFSCYMSISNFQVRDRNSVTQGRYLQNQVHSSGISISPLLIESMTSCGALPSIVHPTDWKSNKIENYAAIYE